MSTQHHTLLSLSLLLLLLGTASFIGFVGFADAVEASGNAPRVATGGNHAAVASSRPFNVFGYLPEYRQRADFPYEDLFRQGLTHLIFFSVEINKETGEFKPEQYEDRLPQGEQWRHVRELADAYGVKLMVCIGGGGRSDGFPALIRQASRRHAFIHTLNDWALSKELDGVDFNWEYPHHNEEWSHFGTLLLEVRSTLGYASLPPLPTSAASSTLPMPVEAEESGAHVSLAQRMAHWRAHRIDPQELSRGRTGRAREPSEPARRRMRVREMVLSVALHPHPSLGPVLQDHKVLRSVDYLHWMAYDSPLQGRPHSGVDYAATTLTSAYLNPLSDAFYYAAQPASPLHPKLGLHTTRLPVPAVKVDHRRKVTLGIPFYGRVTHNLEANPEPYERLVYFIRQWVRKVHPGWREDGPELRDMNEYGGYNYNSYNDVRKKMKLARTLPLTDPLKQSTPQHTNEDACNTSADACGIAGIMIWELGQDLLPPSHEPLSLMRAVGDQLRAWAGPPAPVPAGVAARPPAASSASTTVSTRNPDDARADARDSDDGDL